MTFTGKEIYYLHVCHRKLWLFRHGIRPEMGNDDVQIGMLVQQTSFTRERKEIQIGDFGVLDWTDFKDGVIHETKKGRSISEADRAQAAFYLYCLNKNGVNVREAVLHYPLLRKTDSVLWSPELEQRVSADCREMEVICSNDVPPSVHVCTICKKCAYQEVCFS